MDYTPMRGIPIGVQSFTKVRDLNLYYVDKTDLIDSILNDVGTEMFLYTRPRRFGKSLNLSMLDAYLNIQHKGNPWFEGLSISMKRPDDPIKNSYPVIYMDLKGAGCGWLLRIPGPNPCEDHRHICSFQLPFGIGAYSIHLQGPFHPG